MLYYERLVLFSSRPVMKCWILFYNGPFQDQTNDGKGERQRCHRFNEQSNKKACCTCRAVTTLHVQHAFFCLSTATSKKCLIKSFMEDVNKQWQHFLSLSKLGYGWTVLWNSTPGEFTYIWVSKWVGIIKVTIKKNTKVQVLSELFAAVATSFVFAFALYSCNWTNTRNNIFIRWSVSPAYIGKRYLKKLNTYDTRTQHYPDKHVHVYLATCRENGVHKLFHSSPQCCSPCRCVTRGRHGGTARSTSAWVGSLRESIRIQSFLYTTC